MKKVKIYGLCDAGGYVRYVGKTGDTLRSRLIDHISEANTHLDAHSHKLHWLRLLLKKGIMPEIRLLDEVDESLWQDAERAWIAWLRFVFPDLTNTTDGGLGGCGVSGTTKLTEAQVVDIRERYANGECTQQELADQYGIVFSNVSMIVRGETWQDVGGPRTLTGPAIYGERHHNSRLTAMDVQCIRKQYARGGITYDDLARRYNVHSVTIGDIIRGATWTTV